MRVKQTCEPLSLRFEVHLTLSEFHRLSHLSFPDWCSALAPQLHSPSPGNQLESTESIFQFRFLQMFYTRIHCVSNIGFPMQWLLWTSFSSSLLVWSRFQGVQHGRIAADTLHPGMAVALTITTKGRREALISKPKGVFTCTSIPDP